MESSGYEELGIAAALSRPWDYPTACDELSAMLRLGYAHLPKPLQFLVFQDTLLAFRILPDIQPGYGVAAASSLLQAAEAVLPKQKKAAAVSEFKRSVVAHKRRSKSHYDGDTVELSQDVLIRLFSFLDMRSLVAAGLVCKSWNSAAKENTLWKIEYSLFFGSSSVKEIDTPYDFDWKNCFQEKYKAELAVGAPTNRAVCRNCHSVVWLSTLTSRAPHSCAKLGQNKPKLKLISPRKVLVDSTPINLLPSWDITASGNISHFCIAYLLQIYFDEQFPKLVLGEDLWSELGFDTDDQDSDSDEISCTQYRFRKLWAY